MALCIDSTHKTNAYDFFLTTLLLIDNFGEGLPVAWMISNREDKDNILLFFKVLKKCAGSIRPQWFMSDDNEQYFTAWSDIFGTSQTKKILCAWHIDRAWRKALNQHIPSQDDRVQIYHQLRMLLTETNESEFRVMLQTFLTYSEKYHFNF